MIARFKDHNECQREGTRYDRITQTNDRGSSDPELLCSNHSSQQLLPHPHLHCLIPAGGISADGSKWISCRPKFFLPVQVLSAMFRGKLLDFLKKAYAEGKLRFSGKLKELTRSYAV